MLASCCATWFAANPARAQDATAKATAVQLFDEADQLMNAGKFGQACPKYAASMKLDPQLGALLHLADCYAKNGQVASAWGTFREAEETARNRGDERAAFAKEQAALLEPRVSRVTLVVAGAASVPGLEVRVDGAPTLQGVWGMASPVDPGSHVLEARATGYQTWSSTFKVAGDAQAVRVEVPELKAVGAPNSTPAVAVSPAPPPSAEQSGPWKIVGWTGVGLGVVGLGVGAVFLVQKNSKVDERDKVCPSYMCTTLEQTQRIQSLTSEAKTANTLSTVGFAAGGVLIAGGLVALLAGPKSESKPQTAWLIPSTSRDGAGLAAGMIW